MEQRGTFVFYKSFYEAIEGLPVEQHDRILSAIIEYGLYGTEMELSGVDRIVFTLVKPTLDKSRENYENGKKGGRPKKATTVSKNENGGFETVSKNEKGGFEDEKAGLNYLKTYKDKDKDKDSDLDSDKDESPPYTPPAPSSSAKPFSSTPSYRPEWFERFFELYPRKQAKSVAAAAWDNLRPSRELCDTMAEAIKEQMKSKQWQDPTLIPNPAKWLNEARWEDELEDGDPNHDSWYI